MNDTTVRTDLNIIFRPLDQSLMERHIAALVDIDRLSFGQHGAWKEREFRMDLPKKWELSLAAFDNAGLAGYAIISESHQLVAHLHRLAVAPDRARRGIGRSLMKLSIERARTRSIWKMTLEVPGNGGIEGFYRHFGFMQMTAEEIYSYLTARNKLERRNHYSGPGADRLVYYLEMNGGIGKP